MVTDWDTEGILLCVDCESNEVIGNEVSNSRNGI
jgi:parallel beta-helix repeat protein